MVEWKKLGEVEDSGILTLGRGQVISKIDMNDCPGDFPVYSSSSQNNGEIGRYGKYMFDDERITWSIDGGGKLFYRNGLKYSVTNVCGWLKVNDGNKLNTKFLNYLLFEEWTNIIFDYNHKAHPSVIRNEYQIPIIPLEEQTRIVGILDTFTFAIDNLKEQIAQRRKQYEYYRDQLLDLEGKEDKDIHSWGEFCKMEKGNGVQKADFVEEGIGCIHYGQIYTHYGPYTYETNKYVSKETFEKAKKASKGDIIMTDTSENVEDICKSVAWLGEEDIAVSNHALIIKHSQDPKFLSFSTETNSFFNQKRKVVVGVKVSGIKPEHLAQIKIYLPSLQEQRRIVSILDTFEASIQNLEAQLKEREKQYEYYRNKLLTFE